MIDISFVSDFITEICDEINGKEWKWDYNVVIGKVISCVPVYNICGQYKEGEPSVEDVEKGIGKRYG